MRTERSKNFLDKTMNSGTDTSGARAVPSVTSDISSDESEAGKDQDACLRQFQGSNSNEKSKHSTKNTQKQQQVPEYQNQKRNGLDSPKALHSQYIIQCQEDTHQCSRSSNYTQPALVSTSALRSTILPSSKPISPAIAAVGHDPASLPANVAITTLIDISGHVAVDNFTIKLATCPTASLLTTVRPIAVINNVSCCTSSSKPGDNTLCQSCSSIPSTVDNAPDRSFHPIAAKIARVDDIPNISIHSIPSPMTKSDNTSSRSTYPIPRIDDISTRPTQLIPRTDDISSRPSRPIPRTDGISSRPARSIPWTDDVSSPPTRFAPRTDDISSRPARSTPKADNMSSRPNCSISSSDNTSPRPIRPAPKKEGVARLSTPPTHIFKLEPKTDAAKSTSKSEATAATITTTTDDSTLHRKPKSRSAGITLFHPNLAFTPLDDKVSSEANQNEALVEQHSFNSPRFSIPSPSSSVSSGSGRYSPYYYSQFSPHSHTRAASPIPTRRFSAGTAIQMDLLQGFLDRHSNGHILYPKLKPSKCCHLDGCVESDHDHYHDHDGLMNEDSSCSSFSSVSASSNNESESDRSEGTDQGDQEEDEDLRNRMLLLSQSPNLDYHDFKRDFFMTEGQATASYRSADSPVFFQGFPLLNMTRIE
ncbi:hypothetical protein FBU30_004521 [Linnemannia zychae]|nr:hypothetical protein FBU30_004521 [Linnemannia zychae]